MTSYNLSVHPSTHKTYVHPWYSALKKLESTTNSESKSTLKQPPEKTGVKPTNEKQNPYGSENPCPLQVEEDLARYGEK
jgi:hypothetical protein